MAQIANSSRLTNSAVNIIGSTTAMNTNFGLTRIGVTGNSFDISSYSGTVTLGITGTGTVQIGNATSGTVTFPGTTSFTQPVSGGTFSGTAINGTLATTAMTIGGNLSTGSVSIANTGSATTVTLGNNGGSAIGTVNVGVSSTTVNVGTTTNTAIVLGKAGGTVTLGPALTLGAAPTSGTTAQLGSYQILTTGTITGTGGMNSLITLPVLPIGVYILTGSIFITSTPYSSNIQFGLNGTTQNSNLQNILSTSGSVAGLVRINVMWVQTSAVNVYFSAGGSATFESISASYLRIA